MFILQNQFMDFNPVVKVMLWEERKRERENYSVPNVFTRSQLYLFRPHILYNGDC
jgi:hypothetical protein